jgi:hypothetical protein
VLADGEIVVEIELGLYGDVQQRVLKTVLVFSVGIFIERNGVGQTIVVIAILRQSLIQVTLRRDVILAVGEHSTAIGIRTEERTLDITKDDGAVDVPSV